MILDVIYLTPHRPYTALASLEQADGDWNFVLHMVQTFCIDARTKIVSCSRAARVSDTTTLRSEAHSMRGGAAACCATQLENSCGVLERSARLDQELSLAMNDTSSITSSAAKSPEDWKMMVETNVAECLTQLSQNVDALTSMRTLPSFNTLQDVCAEWNNDAIVGALSDLLEVAVNAYVAAHTAIFKEECNVGEVPFSVAREKLGLACAAADALAVRELVRTAGLLSDHLIKSPSGETLANKVHENERKKNMLVDMRVTVESLAAELVIILGERMPVLDIPFADDIPKSAAGDLSSAEDSVVTCDYPLLSHNTGDKHKFVVALLSSFKDSLIVFCDGLANQTCSLLDVHSLHGAAVSLCTPRVVAAIAEFFVVPHDRAAKVRRLRAAVDELANFVRALEDGKPPDLIRPTNGAARSL